MSRATIISSASAGIPGTPSRLDHSPSCMWPPRASASSSQCCARVTSKPRAYSRARRMTATSCTPVPSSVKRRTPNEASSPMGARRSPARPMVMAPATATTADGPRTQGEHLEGDRGTVDRRVGVGHGHHRREPPQRGRPRPGLDRLGVLGAGLAQVGVQVHESRATPGTRRRRAPWPRGARRDRDRPRPPGPARPPRRRPARPRRRRRCLPGSRRWAWPGPWTVHPEATVQAPRTVPDGRCKRRRQIRCRRRPTPPVRAT